MPGAPRHGSFRHVLQTTVPSTFPLSISANGKYLQTASGAPFLQVGKSAWLLPAQISASAQNTWLTDIASRGFNAAYVQVFCKRCDRANDQSAAGNNPFTNIGTLAVNSAYLADLQTLASNAKSRGIFLWFSFYYGYAADSADGYYNEFVTGGATNCRTMASAVASALVPYGNVGFQIGGDYTPPNTTVSAAIYDGIRDVSSSVLVTGYWGSSPGTTSRDFAGRAWYDLCGVSAWGLSSDWPHDLVASVYGAGTPVALMEGKYEHNDAYGWSRFLLRSNALNSFLRGALGGIYYGNEYEWTVDSTDHPSQSGAPVGHSYTEYLADPGCLDAARIGNFLRGLSQWQNLVPDVSSALVTSARSSADTYVGAAKSADSRLALVYAPTASAVTIARSQMAGTITAQWWDPTQANGALAYSTAGAGTYSNTGTVALTPPTNSAGDADQVLVLTCP